MDQFPDEILLRILMGLTTKDLIRCSKVNHRWHRLCQDKTLWRIVDLSLCSVLLRSLGKLVKQHGVSSLILKQSTIKDPASSWQNTFPPNELKMIDLSGANISPRGVGHILKSTSHLVDLNVSGCTINHIAYKAIASNAQLRQLNLNSCKLPSAGFRAIFSGCNALEEVDLGYLSKLYRQINFIKSSTLRRLCVKYCELNYWEIKRLVQQCPNLTHLDISFNVVGSHGAEKLRKSLSFLVELLHTESVDEHESDYDTDNDTGTGTDTEWETQEDDSD